MMREEAESPSSPETEPVTTRIVGRIEWALAAGATLIALSFHTIFYMKAGPLWRDEINSVNLASLSLGEIWQNVQFDSFPPGWLVTLHAWITLLGPENDSGFRVLGILTGLTLLAVVWFAGLEMSGRPPLVAITLLLLSASVIRFGDSIRGYGLGMIGGVVCIWALHRFAVRGDRHSFVLAVIAATLSVQFLYYNAVTVFASCVAAAVVGLTNRSYKRAANSILIGVVAAISLIPLVPVIRSAAGWNDLVRYDVDLRWLHWMWQSTIESSGRGIVAVWYLLLAAAVVVSAMTFRNLRSSGEVSGPAVFHSVLLITGTVSYIVFLLALSYITAPWYYLALIVLQAVSIDGILSRGLPTRGRLLLVTVLLAGLLVSFPATRAFVSSRTTNVDLAAAFLETTASAQDLIVVTPWEIGITFARHFDGPAGWESVPPLGPLRWHRYDLFRESLGSPNATFALFTQINDTLHAGHRVFVVANMTKMPPEGVEAPMARNLDQVLPARTLFESLARAGYQFRDVVPLEPATDYETARILEIVRN